jgi:FkbM family methyltransferase
MSSNFLKSVVLKLVSGGLKIPEGRIDRVIELIHLKALLSELNINCVLDVGANRGQFAGELRGIGYTGHIISFEPLKQEFASMARRFLPDPKWMGYQVALGSEEKTAKINITRRTDLSSFLRLREDESVIECQDVEIKRLDSLLPRLVQQIPSPRIFLKMDTQGFDLEVFKGASGCVESLLGLQSELSIRPIYEDMPHYLEALRMYEASGYELYNLSAVARVFGKGLVEVNCFMKRAPARNNAGMDSDTVYLRALAAGL